MGRNHVGFCGTAAYRYALSPARVVDRSPVSLELWANYEVQTPSDFAVSRDRKVKSDTHRKNLRGFLVCEPGSEEAWPAAQKQMGAFFWHAVFSACVFILFLICMQHGMTHACAAARRAGPGDRAHTPIVPGKNLNLDLYGGQLLLC